MSIKSAINRVIKSGQFVLGKEVELFEKNIQEYLDVKYAIGVNSGTDALFLSLKALEIGEGDEVITTPFTFIATSGAIANCGAKPVFVDIRDDFNIDTSLIEKAITRRTKAILPVHLFGKQANMEEIMKIAKKHKLRVLEDSAQGFGIRLTGDIAGISFYPTKSLGAYGDAGMVITNNKKLAYKVRLLRNHGSSPREKYFHLTMGFNSRLDELQAAILSEKLKCFSEGFSYDKTKYYPIPLHLQPCFRYLNYHKGDFPKAEKYAKIIKHGKRRTKNKN